MNIAVLGAGAMGALFGSYLSQMNDVYLVDINSRRVSQINENDVIIQEGETTRHFHPRAVSDTGTLPVMDLILVFVKAMHTQAALEANRALIGPDTYLMTLQNGAGHETALLRFADAEHVVLGCTQHNSSITPDGRISHGGGGKTSIGLPRGGSERLAPIALAFTRCGFACDCSDDVNRQIWSKLILNASASALTAVLQVPLGFILREAHAAALLERLVREAVAVANAKEHFGFEEKALLEEIRSVLQNAAGGYTSIYMDVKNGARTEVDTISGHIVQTADALGVDVPCHRMMVDLIHAMEARELT